MAKGRNNTEWITEGKKESWVADVKKESWDILKKHMRLVTIFKFDSQQQHHGNLEGVILDALFKCKDFFINLFEKFVFHLAAQVSGGNNGQYDRTSELKLATVVYRQKKLMH